MLLSRLSRPVLRSSIANRSLASPIRMVQTEKRIEELGIKLPVMPTPLAMYIPYVRSGNLIHLAGHVPFKDDMKTLHVGKVGVDYSVEEGYAFARTIGLELMSTLQVACGGDLDKVKRIVKLVGFVNCPDDFGNQPEVINGCSEVIGEVFGKERGSHARSAVGTNSLPRQVPVEIEMIAEVAD